MQATIRSLGDYHNPHPVPVRESPMAHHRAGLTWTATGYGARIATDTMIKFNGKWRRVYCCIYSNSGTLYIGKLSDNLRVQDYQS